MAMLLDNPSFTQTTDRGPSPGLFNAAGGAPTISAMRDNPTLGWFIDHLFNPFRTSSNINAAEAHWCDGWQAFGSNGAAIAVESDERSPVITLSSDGDDEGASIRPMIFPFQISTSTGNVWFEAGVKTSTIADTKHGFLVGLGDSTAFTATMPLTAAGALGDMNLVGFHRLEGDGDYVDTVYKADGVTAVTVASDAQVLVADTFIKLGFVYDSQTLRLTFYVNGSPLSATKTIPSAAGTDFPNDVRLAPFFALLNATGTTPGNSSIKFLRCIQTPVDNVT